MAGARLHDGTPQDLYFPLTDENFPGKFKGMVNILIERGYHHADKLHAQCDPGFKCTLEQDLAAVGEFYSMSQILLMLNQI